MPEAHGDRLKNKDKQNEYVLTREQMFAIINT